MALALGHSGDGKLGLTTEERSRHIHLVGASGTGKSKLLEAMIRADLTAGRGLCLIDPHGTLADAVVRWCAATRVDEVRRIHVIEAGNREWCAGFNPLRFDDHTETQVRVDAVLAACAQVWGGEDTNATPLLKKCLRAVFYTLAVRGLTLAEALLLTSSDSAMRQLLSEGLEDPVFESVWRDFRALSRRDFAEQFSSTNNRLMEFLSSPVVRRIVGQRERALDLRAVMDRGEVVIVNLAPQGALSFDNARLLGTLLTSELLLQALGRDQATARRHPFTLYIDECYDYLTSDIAKMLDQTRKFGLHLVLAHQRLAQLQMRSRDIFNGVMAGGQTKIVFGGLPDEDAVILADEVMRASYNLERPKHVLDKPIVVDEVPVWLSSESDTESWSSSDGSGRSHSYGSSRGASQATSDAYDNERMLRGSTESAGDQWGTSEAWGSSASSMTTTGGSRTRGRSETLKPVRATMPTAVHSLEEERHLATVGLRELPNREAILRRRGYPPVRFRTRDIRPAFATPEQIARFLERVRVGSPYLAPTSEADAEIADRTRALAPLLREAPEPAFWSEDA